MGSNDFLPDLGVKPKILFVDAFDSFSNNIVGMLNQCIGADITMVHINDSRVTSNLESVLGDFDAVVVGPGPGHPGNPQDVGFVERLWQLSDDNMLPVLGICLGFQSLCLHYGASVQRLTQARHGIVSSPTHRDADIFEGIRDLYATQYHSLKASLRPSDSSGDAFWEPTDQCPQLRPLAWDLSDDINGPILMGVRHTDKPFWGVQFHPESICTSPSGRDLVANWWKKAQDGSGKTRYRSRQINSGEVQRPLTPISLESKDSSIDKTHLNGNGSPTSPLASLLKFTLGSKPPFLRWGRHSGISITATELVEALGIDRDEMILLDSQNDVRGRFSILGLVVPDTIKVTYKVTEKTLRWGNSATKMHQQAMNSIDQVWPMLQEALDMHDPLQSSSSRASSPGPEIEYTGLDRFVAGHLPAEIPFWGGFMGFITYEAGLETIDVELHGSCKSDSFPDINFAFIHRSIVIDHQNNQIIIQSLLPGDWAWILEAGRLVDNIREVSPLSDDGSSRHNTSCVDTKQDAKLSCIMSHASTFKPSESSYRAKVRECQEFLATGDSYELCLTDETKITMPVGTNKLDPWALYKRLRANNPAPYGAYMRLSDVKVVGSSPELFLKWDRGGRCQFRPIKGTVKKGPNMTRERAHEILRSSKEQAENLMIVDLIRHDLCGVVGVDNQWVSDLMVVEEYEKVYQLISVIEGQLPSRESAPNGLRGLDVLKSSLPPGSMTGAPKKRSCEILREIERRPRGIYSGVLGYMDVGGGGSFSVVIRTALCRDKPEQQPREEPHTSNGRSNGDIGTISNGVSHANGYSEHETWRVGAGGAVTIQSTDEAEFAEMETKSSSVLEALFRSK